LTQTGTWAEKKSQSLERRPPYPQIRKESEGQLDAAPGEEGGGRGVGKKKFWNKKTRKNNHDKGWATRNVPQSLDRGLKKIPYKEGDIGCPKWLGLQQR